MDKRLFLCRAAHLRMGWGCGRSTFPAVPRKGINPQNRHRLWTTSWLCWFCPQVCPAGPPFSVSRAGLHRPAGCTCLQKGGPASPWDKPARQGPRFLRPQTRRLGSACPPRGLCTAPDGAPGYSLRLLFKNSSSSKAALFMWTSGFFSIRTRVCAAPKGVGGGRGRAAVEMNNLGGRFVFVDNLLFTSFLSPGLSTDG